MFWTSAIWLHLVKEKWWLWTFVLKCQHRPASISTFWRVIPDPDKISLLSLASSGAELPKDAPLSAAKCEKHVSFEVRFWILNIFCLRRPAHFLQLSDGELAQTPEHLAVTLISCTGSIWSFKGSFSSAGPPGPFSWKVYLRGQVLWKWSWYMVGREAWTSFQLRWLVLWIKTYF